ncbi:MAG: hypothetical protein HYX73_01150 [Acidobacteria bacterium]|nr:hypothetical protein [Acidobacteriota bacterium]
MRRIAIIVTGGAAAVAWGKLTPTAAAQCAMCRTGLLNSPEGQQLIAGFNSGILFLLAVPILICFSVLFLLWRAARKRSLAAEQVWNAPWKETPAIGSAQLSEEKPSPQEELGEPA